MTADIGPGDFLEAIRSIANEFGALEKGRIYTCVSVDPMDDGCSVHGETCKPDRLMIREAPTPEPWGWCSCLFRPVRRPDSRKMLRRLAGDPVLNWEGPVRRTPVEAVSTVAA
jgi:hypothetical protein